MFAVLCCCAVFAASMDAQAYSLTITRDMSLSCLETWVFPVNVNVNNLLCHSDAVLPRF